MPSTAIDTIMTAPPIHKSFWLQGRHIISYSPHTKTLVSLLVTTEFWLRYISKLKTKNCRHRIANRIIHFSEEHWMWWIRGFKCTEDIFLHIPKARKFRMTKFVVNKFLSLPASTYLVIFEHSKNHWKITTAVQGSLRKLHWRK